MYLLRPKRTAMKDLSKPSQITADDLMELYLRATKNNGKPPTYLPVIRTSIDKSKSKTYYLKHSGGFSKESTITAYTFSQIMAHLRSEGGGLFGKSKPKVEEEEPEVLISDFNPREFEQSKFHVLHLQRTGWWIHPEMNRLMTGNGVVVPKPLWRVHNDLINHQEDEQFWSTLRNREERTVLMKNDLESALRVGEQAHEVNVINPDHVRNMIKGVILKDALREAAAAAAAAQPMGWNVKGDEWLIYLGAMDAEAESQANKIRKRSPPEAMQVMHTLMPDIVEAAEKVRARAVEREAGARAAGKPTPDADGDTAWYAVDRALSTQVADLFKKSDKVEEIQKEALGQNRTYEQVLAEAKEAEVLKEEDRLWSRWDAHAAEVTRWKQEATQHLNHHEGDFVNIWLATMKENKEMVQLITFILRLLAGASVSAKGGKHTKKRNSRRHKREKSRKSRKHRRKSRKHRRKSNKKRR